MNTIDTMLQMKRWAVVGATDNKEKYGYKIFKTLLEAGYEVYPVNPGLKEILGKTCYASLSELPVKPEAVNFVVPPKIGEQVLRQCAELEITNVWLQPGANTPPVVKVAQELGFTVISDACILIEVRNRG